MPHGAVQAVPPRTTGLCPPRAAYSERQLERDSQEMETFTRKVAISD